MGSNPQCRVCDSNDLTTGPLSDNLQQQILYGKCYCGKLVSPILTSYDLPLVTFDPELVFSRPLQVSARSQIRNNRKLRKNIFFPFFRIFDGRFDLLALWSHDQFSKATCIVLPASSAPIFDSIGECLLPVSR